MQWGNVVASQKNIALGTKLRTHILDESKAAADRTPYNTAHLGLYNNDFNSRNYQNMEITNK